MERKVIMERVKRTDSDEEFLGFVEISEEEEFIDKRYKIGPDDRDDISAASNHSVMNKSFPPFPNLVKFAPTANEQIVIINNQPISLANQSIIKFNKNPQTLAAKPGNFRGIGTSKSMMTNSNTLGRFIVKSSNGQSFTLATPPTAINYSTGTAKSANKCAPSLMHPMSLVTSDKPNVPSTVAMLPSTQSATNALVISSQTSTLSSSTIATKHLTKIVTRNSSSTTEAIPSRLPMTASNTQKQKIFIRSGGIQHQVMVPAHNLAVHFPEKRMKYVHMNPKGVAEQNQVTAASVATVTGPLNKTSKIADCSIGTLTIKPKNSQQKTPAKATTSGIISPVKQETKQVSTGSSGGYRFLNSFGAITENSVVNKFETLGSAQYAKNHVNKKKLNDTEFLHSFGNPSKYLRIHHDFKYEDGQFYQNVASVKPPATAAPDAGTDDVVQHRKTCNCTKSQCRKLYCDCFANGEFCHSNCNCKGCVNNLKNEVEREKAVRSCLDRNPMAFKSKIGQINDQTVALRRHIIGCNCKRSGCLKNYCECYIAKVACSENCKCTDCRNIEYFDGNGIDKSHPNDRTHTNSLNSSMTEPSSSGTFETEASGSGTTALLNNSDMNITTFEQQGDLESSTFLNNKSFNYLTPDVIDATILCAIAQAEECQKNQMDKKKSERLIVEEFGRCLVEIIAFSQQTNDK